MSFAAADTTGGCILNRQGGNKPQGSSLWEGQGQDSAWGGPAGAGTTGCSNQAP